METQSFTRKELYELVWSQPMLTLANHYQISDVGLRKICVKHGIPLPKAGHWQKIKFGKKVKQVPLPAGNSADQLITLKIRAAGERVMASEPSPEKILQLKIENELESGLTVPVRLLKPDQLIVAAKNSLLVSRVDDFTYLGMSITLA